MNKSKFLIGRIIFLISVILVLCVGCSDKKMKSETKSELQMNVTESSSKMDLHIETEEELVALLTQPVSEQEA